ncbi:MAG: LysR family transcriptional regulator [Comamonadaceae bacterium]|nr:MAG: LysR family transcriptional regulator [Comamonadaceae bacterium]
MITELKTLLAVVRYGGFTAAGEKIGLTQSAVSNQIQRLEDSLGFPLFDRTRRSAVLNEDGAKVLIRAEKIVSLVARLGDPEDMEDAVDTLHIGAIASVQADLLPRALAVLRRSRPRLRINITPGVSLKLMDQLDSAEIDAAVMIRPPFGLMPELSWQTLVYEPFKLLVPRTVKGNDWREVIQQQPFLRYERTSFGGRMVTGFLRENGLVVDDAIELDEISGLMTLVSQGCGVALVPMVDAYLPMPPNIRALSLSEKTFYREIGILRKKRSARHQLLSELEKCLKDAISPAPADKPGGRRPVSQAGAAATPHTDKPRSPPTRSNSRPRPASGC